MLISIGRQLALITACLLVWSASYADIYQCVGSDGVPELTNQPSSPRYKGKRCVLKYKSQKPRTSASAPSSYAPTRTVFKGSGYVGAGSRRPFAVDKANQRRFAPVVERIARRHRLDPALVKAVISAESAFDPRARSPKGAMGLMQLMPATARRFGVADAYDPVANIQGGSRYLRWLMDRFGNNTRLVLAAYNAGEGAVIKYGNQIPPYRETRTYVSRVLGFYESYRRRSRNHVVLSPTVARADSGEPVAAVD